MQPTQDPGSTLNTAYNIGNIGGLQSFTEFVGSTDTTDIYKFTLTQTSNVDLLMTDYDGRLDLQLIIDSNENGRIDDEEIIYDKGYYSSSGAFNSALGAADYFVRVVQESNTTNTNYRLDLSANPTPSSTETDPGSTLDGSYSIGNIGELQSFTEFAGSTDTTDIYKFTLTQTSNVDLLMTDYDGRLDLQLIIDSNENGRIDDEEIIYDKGYYSSSGAFNSALGAADYFVRVVQESNTTNTNYRLDLSANPTPSSTETDPGSTLDGSYSIGNIGELQSFTEFAGSTDTTDIYKFTLTQTSNVDLLMTDYDGRLDLQLIIDSNENGRIDDEEIIYDKGYYSSSGAFNSALGAADYFVRVVQESNTTNTNYRLDLSANPTPSSTETDPGSTLDGSYSIENTNLNTSEDNRNLTEFVGSTDTTDIYKFSLLQTTELDLLMTDYSGRLDLQLIIDNNENDQIDDGEIIYDKSYYSSSGEFNSTLGAADYFIRVVQESDITNTNYNLDLKFSGNPINSIITLEALDTEASENENDTGLVRISRLGDTSKAQTVTYNIATGNQQARNGVDYAELSGSVIIPEDRYYVDLVVAPIDDGHEEILEQVNITLTGVDNDGVLGIEKTARVTISDNDEPDSLPFVSNPIADLTVNEDAANRVVDLSNVFNDLDNDEITLAIKTNSNSQLVSTSLNGTDLTLGFADDRFGTSNITVEATANGEAVSDTFTVTVNEVVDVPSMVYADVHRFYQYEKGYHLYTSDMNEINYVREKSNEGELSYDYESEKYKVLADNKDIVTGEEIEGVEPIYRFFNNETGAHLYTMDANEKNYIQDNLSNYSFEGIKYYAFESEPENIDTIPVYRMLNTSSGAHLFSSDINEIGHIESNLPNFSMENGGNAAFHVFEL